MLDFIEGEDEPDYTPEDVKVCITSLLAFMSSIESESQTIDSVKAHIKALALTLNALNEQCDGGLIDTVQREDIGEFIQKVISAAKVEFVSDITEELNVW